MLMADTNSLPLSYSQQGLWVVYLENTQSGAYNMALPLQFSEIPDVFLLRKTLMLLCAQHAALRSRFYEVDGVAYQAFDAELQNAWQEVDATGWSDDVLMAQAHHYLQQPFILESAVFRTTFFTGAETGALLLITLHHIAGDLTSLNIFGMQLVKIYQDLLAKGEASLPINEHGYDAFVPWEKERLYSKFGKRMSTYWQKQLSGDMPVLQLQTDFPRQPLQTFNGASFNFNLPKDLLASINVLANANKTTLSSVLLSSYQALLHRYTGQPVIWVAVPTSMPRTLPLFKDMIGYLVNPMIITADFGDIENLSFIQLLRHTNKQILTGLYHQPYPFIDLVNQLHIQHDPSYPPLVQTMFALAQENLVARQFVAGQTRATRRDLAQMEGQFDVLLTWFDSEDEETLTGTLGYNRDLFKPDTIQKMAEHMLTLLQCIVAQPDAPLNTLPLLVPAEQQQLQAWNASVVDYPQDQTIVSLFEAQVQCTPDNTAVVFEDQHLTYAGLNARANQLAYHLRQHPVFIAHSTTSPSNPLIALCVERSLEMMVGLLGILKAGGTYVPFDPAYPTERLRYMLSDCGAKLLLTQNSLQDKLAGMMSGEGGNVADYSGCEWLCLYNTDFSYYPTSDLLLQVEPTDLAYIIYTSGSTGQPKGVMVEHGALASHTRTMQQQFGLGATDRVLQFASMSFDVALEQILPALISGARVVIAQPHWSLDEFSTHLQAQQVTVCDLPPAYLHQVLAHWQTQQWQATPVSLRLMIVGNDVVPPETVALWREMGRGIRLLNAYGPTEATITATCHELDVQAIPTGKVPIGCPLPGKTAYVLDTALQPLPIGVPGELYLGGSGVARGYWERDDLTAERFLANPFGAGRLYRTGDLARWLPDGTLEFIGRVDHQVKLRGFRIELGEIETVLNQHPAVHEAAVIVREDQPGQKRLIAYWTAKPFADASNTDIMQHLQAALPAYMVPSICVLLEAMPQTANGKINRKALPVPTETEAANDTQYTAPTQPVEQQLADIWASVLGRESVGIHDNFFALGGDSILSLQVVSRARQQGLLFQPKQLFQYQTIAKLASVVEQLASIATLNTQGQVSGKVELTPVQHWFFAQDFAEAQHHNLAFRAEVAAELTPETLTHAWQQVALHHDALRSRFVQQDGLWHQSCTAELSELTLAVIDLTGLPPEEQQARWESECRRLQASLSLATGELQRMALFRLGEQQPPSLFWCIHHLVVDGVSWRVLLEDLQTACGQLQQGQGVKLPAKTTAFQTWAAWLAQDAVPYVQAELAYWQGVCANPTRTLAADYHANTTANTVASQAHIVRQLSVADTRSLLQDAHQAYHTQVNDLLLTALLQAYQQRTGQSRLRLDLEGHGREVLDTPPGGVAVPAFDLSRTVGWFTSIYPVALTLQSKDTASAIKAVKEQLRAIPNRGMGYGILRYLGKADGLAGQAELCFNYLGQFDASAADTAVLRHAMLDMTTQPHSPQQQRPYALEINCLVMEGQLQVDCAYSTDLHKPATVESFADAFMTALQAVLAHCRDPQAGGYTRSDFAQAKLKQNQLDQLLNRIKVNKRK